ncbi:MAG: 30S ribosomal protein S20 [Firmicutes bacterium]|nr:30S ribosomal protein S20 [Bacillota bacterium]
MANTPSAKKRIRLTARQTARNRAIRSTYRTAIKRFEKALAENDLEKARELLRVAISRIDWAVTKGVIHKNAANRRKSRLTKRLNQAQAQAS